MAAEPDAPTARAQDPLVVGQCSLGGLRDKLPLRWPTPPGTPPCPKRAYRSSYSYPGWQDLCNPATWQHLSDFDLTLRLVDFNGLRPVLAQRLDWTSARGWMPFDPVSLFLLHGWQITNRWNRTQTLHNLHDSRYADYAHRFGFRDTIFPTEGGLRYFLTTLGRHAHIPAQTVAISLDDGRIIAVPIDNLNDLIAGSVQVLAAAGVLSQSAWQAALVCPDGMIHDAASRMRCAFVQDSCYQPLSADHPQRSCPARVTDPPHRGCTCTTSACATVCRFATPRDPEARLVVYKGSNRQADHPNQPVTPTPTHAKEGKPRYGYRSIPLQLADRQRRTSVVLLDTVLPAPEREENPAAALLRQAPRLYPDLHIETTAGDAGLGYAAYLHTAYELGIKRVVDLRTDPTDANKETWVSRRYDDKGRPLCPFGYAFSSNGYDAQRKCHKWICAQACLTHTEPRVTLTTATYPPHECPYRADDHPHGQTLNVGERFADGSIRLARDVPVETPAWERTYHRARNASESRHSTLEGWGLKRLPVYGLLRGKALIFQADAWANLTTLARVICEATLAAGGP